MIVLLRGLAAVLPAVLLGAYAYWPALAFVPWIAIVPWVLLYTDDRRPRVSIGWYAIGALLSWVLQHTETFRYGWYVPFAMGAVLAFWYLPFAPALRFVHHRLHLPRSVSVAVVWVAVEWLRAHLTLSSFDLYGLGYSQARFPWFVQIVDVTGIYGISFLMAAFAGLVADALFVLRDAGGSLRAVVRARRVRVAAAAIAAGVVLASVYGVYRLSTVGTRPGPRLALIQPNIAHTVRNLVGVHLTQLLMTERAVPPGGADLIVWPENAILDNIRREGAYLDDLAWMAKQKDAWFLVGALGKSETHPGRTKNEAFLIDTEGRIRGEYAKQLLFPWSEYVPGDRFFERISPGLSRLHRNITRMGWGFLPSGEAGHGVEVFDFPWHGETVKLAALICFENTFPPFAAEASRRGARLFVNITSEGEVGGPVQEQLLRIAMIRAIENRASYVRVGNTGISGVIDPLGRLVAILRDARGATIGTAGVLIDAVPLATTGTTLYTRSHDAFVKLDLAAAVLLLGLAALRPRRRGAAAAAVALVALLGGCSSPPPLGSDASAVDATLARGRALRAKGRCGPAVKALAAACATEDGCRAALPDLAGCYERTQDDENGADLFATIADRYPDLAAAALGFRGHFLERALYLDKAERAYRRALDLAPSPALYGRLGTLLLRTDRSDEAIAMLRAGISAFPDNVQLRYILGRSLRIRGDLEDARRVLEEALAIRPDEGSAWVNLGRVRLETGDRDGASEAFRTALRVDPADIEARFMLARLALQAGDLDRVEELIREIRRIEAGLGRGPAPS